VDEAKLVDRLRLVEALFAGASTAGEKAAAESAKQRIPDRLSRWKQEAPTVGLEVGRGLPPLDGRVATGFS
jgi:hypothetical protein